MADQSRPLPRPLYLRAVQSYWRKRRSLTMGAQGIIIGADNQVVLIRHSYRPGWHFPGGGVEKNETAHAALTREVHEETGIQVNGRPQLFGLYANFEYFPSDHIALFIVRDWTQTDRPRSRLEIADCQTFSLDALPPDAVPAVHRRLQEYLGTEAPTDMW